MNRKQVILLLSSFGVLGVSIYSLFYPVYDYILIGITLSYIGFGIYYGKTKSKFKSTRINLGKGQGRIVKI